MRGMETVMEDLWWEQYYDEKEEKAPTYKYDLHCHVHEGTPDSNVYIKQYIDALIEKGFLGMLITDRNTYEGYRQFEKFSKDKIPENVEFYVLKGLEYDTADAGHMLVIMPSGKDYSALENRGMKLEDLISFVHGHDGIIGPAHGFGDAFFSIYSTGRYKYDKGVTFDFDFIEGYNSTQDDEDNLKCRQMAARFGKPIIGGSDSHSLDSVGMAHTSFESIIKSEDELISYIKSGKQPTVFGKRYNEATRDKLGKANKLLGYAFYPINKIGGFINKRRRNINIAMADLNLSSAVRKKSENKPPKIPDEPVANKEES